LQYLWTELKESAKKENICFVCENILDATRILVWTELPFFMSSNNGRVKENVKECRARWFCKLWKLDKKCDIIKCIACWGRKHEEWATVGPKKLKYHCEETFSRLEHFVRCEVSFYTVLELGTYLYTYIGEMLIFKNYLI